MSHTKCISWVAAGATMLGAAGAVYAQQDQATTGDSDEVRALVAEMLADADGRSSLLQGGGVAGHDGKFFLADSSGNFRLNISGQIQLRYNFSIGEDLGNVDGRDYVSNFDLRRVKLDFSGHVIDPNLFYKVKLRSDSDSDFGVDQVYMGYKFGDGWHIKGGSFKIQFLREEVISSAYQLAVERSVVNEVFNQDRSEGVEVGWQNDDLQFFFGFTNGIDSDGSTYGQQRAYNLNGFPVAGNAQYAFNARLNWKFAGQWNQFKDFSSPSGSEFAGMVGGAIYYEGGDANSAANSGSYSYLSYTIDGQIEGDGWNLFAYFVGTNSDIDGLVIAPGVMSDQNFDDYGFVVQGGIMIPDTDWELFGRWSSIFTDGDRANNDDFNVLTLGTNYYWHGQAAKFTADVLYYFDQATGNDLAPGGIPGSGFLDSSDDGEISVRLQFQLLF